jgi:hypothetical protein
MTMNLTLGELVYAEPALDRLLDVKLPAQTAYHIAQLAKAVKAETQHFNTQREAFIRELGVPNGDQSLEVPPEHRAEFFRRMAELAAVEVSLACRPLTLHLLEAQEICGADLLRLGVLVVDTNGTG